MARGFTCQNCKGAFETKTTRGPVPENCPRCKDELGKNHTGSSLVKVTAKARNALFQENIQKALDMRKRYHTWAQIAESCGYASEGAAHNAVKNAMQKRQAQINQTVDELRQQEQEHLEALTEKALEILERTHLVVNSGEVITYKGRELIDSGPALAAIKTLQQVSESRRKLLGLDSATKAEIGHTVKYSVEGIQAEDLP